MAPNNQRLYPNPLLSIDSSTFTGSYQAIGSLATSSRIVKFTNNSTTLVTVSWDGTNDHEVLPGSSFVLLDASANREVSDICEIPLGTTFYVKGSASTGLFYISSYFTR